MSDFEQKLIFIARPSKTGGTSLEFKFEPPLPANPAEFDKLPEEMKPLCNFAYNVFLSVKEQCDD
jgi:hypothetical protein